MGICSGVNYAHKYFTICIITSRGLLRCDAVQCCGRVPTFQRSMLPLSTLHGVITQKTST